ncbi:hypothetical protein [Pseudomonas sp. Irchel 3E13]|uniref:hypothetical protein n=1 Tax=Pseudomonas sp. Irchel 3E13 TaxID=2008975 RepID=UPI000BA4C9F1|nr:hypothetical protein [Pseudomonas sp. Irchel 3E13]
MKANSRFLRLAALATFIALPPVYAAVPTTIDVHREVDGVTHAYQVIALNKTGQDEVVAEYPGH